ncbi:hypothetical protein [Actinobacillus minor]|uniref:hypothetical protein n=1 Tax=Actinobacillus minor TaxID=51047 RepID=UPI0026F05777|nr:hypothetical protein [Actinobacillus minor]
MSNLELQKLKASYKKMQNFHFIANIIILLSLVSSDFGYVVPKWLAAPILIIAIIFAIFGLKQDLAFQKLLDKL